MLQSLVLTLCDRKMVRRWNLEKPPLGNTGAMGPCGSFQGKAAGRHGDRDLDMEWALADWGWG